MNNEGSTGGFGLDSRLVADCHILWHTPQSDVLLMDKPMFRPWFILVPHTHVPELIDLESEQLKAILHQVAALTRFVRAEYQPDKINTATIGNVVSQLHIHIIARYHDDPCWPGTVWGWTPDNGQSRDTQGYPVAEVEAIRQKLLNAADLFC